MEKINVVNCIAQSNKLSNTSSGSKLCICDQLRKLQRVTEVVVFLSGGQTIEDFVFIRFD